MSASVVRRATIAQRRKMETRQCTKCSEIKPIGSFPRRAGKSVHLREYCCGMCKKRAYKASNLERYREKTKQQDVRRRAKTKGISVDEYLAAKSPKPADLCTPRWNAWRDRLRIDGLIVRKNQRHRCPVLAAHKKIEYKINRDYYLTKSKEWGQRNPAQQLAKKQRRRARLAGCTNTLTLSQWNEIKRRYKYRCAYCGAKSKLTRDHVVPLIKLADDSPNNIVPACGSCNASKHVGPPLCPVQTLLFA